MTFDQSLAWLYSTQHFGIKLGLENIRHLLEKSGDPQKSLRFIHVAGTNGKGSVCAMLDSVLRAQGLRVGLYTSPHLVDFRERIRADGRKISPEAVAVGLTRLRAIAETMAQPPTFFEISTALALIFFAQEHCEIVVLETGMGGRLDATNIVTPLVSVITPIALDHTQWLGETLEKVAGEKAGIIKPGVPVVSAGQKEEARRVLETTADSVSSSLQFVETLAEGFTLALRGEHQKANAALAMLALEASGLKPEEDIVREGLRNVVWPGRFQTVDERTILDGAHNPHAALQLVQTWQEIFPGEKATVIFSAVQDKDTAAILEILEPIAARFFFVPVRNERTDVPEKFTALTPVISRCFGSVRLAIEAARSEAGRILIAGSLFLVGDAMEALGLEG